MAGFWNGAGSAIVSAGTSLLGSLFGGLFSSSNQDKQFQQQKELMKYSHELGLENMDYQQKLGHQTFDYTFGKESSLNQRLMENSPTIQKQAMLDAGINPASQFGSFSGNLAQSSAPTYTPQAGAPQAPSFEPFNIAGMFGNLANIFADARLKRSQANLNDENADWLKDLKPNEQRLKDAQAAAEWAKAKFDNVQSNELPKVYEATIDNLLHQNDKLDAEANKLTSDIDVNDANIGKIGAETDLLGAEQSLTKARERNVNMDTARLRATIDNVLSDTRLKDAERKKVIADANKSIEERLFTRHQRLNIHKIWNAEIRKNHSLAQKNKAEMRLQLNKAILSAKEGDWFTFNQVLKAIGVGNQSINSLANLIKAFKWKGIGSAGNN